MWRGSSKPVEKRPTDDARIQALRLNHDHVRGLTRLDQQLVYVPLAALGAALLGLREYPPQATEWMRLAALVALAMMAVVVVVGLMRNHRRHRELLEYRDNLIAGLTLPPVPEWKVHLKEGRLIYAAMFLIGWIAEAVLLMVLLTAAAVR